MPAAVLQAVCRTHGDRRDYRAAVRRLREAAAGIDPDDLAARAAELREGREAEERHTAQEAAQEQERVKELERQQEIERDAHRDRGYGIDR